ncbi:MAG: hypothetical protein B6I31_03800 [Desulfobacteraceae bacterium 4572_19]|nr:MAG: hypothetical protein B6I31_03800 [Desulfobacteraceae bacterium 4572_19]
MKVFENAEFISCEDNNRLFSVLVEDKGKIIFTGDIVPKEYEMADRIDLNKKCVVPAFGDTHIHFSSFSYFNAGLDCRHAVDFNNLGDILNEYIANHSKEKITLCFGCSAHTVKEQRLPERDDLDKITSHPLMIVKYDGHASVANSALINKLPSSVINDNGYDKKTGWFYHNAFFKATNHISKSVSPIELFKNLSMGSDYLAKKGISFIHAAEGVGFPMDIDLDLTRIAALALPLEFRIFFQTLNIKKVIKRKLPRIGGCFKNGLDGCFGSVDAALNEPYSNNSKNRGVLFYTQEQVNKFMIDANRKGLQIAVHAIGDAAIEQALCGYETALADFPRDDHRHIIIHADLMNGTAIERAVKSNIHIALQTPFLHWKEEPMEYIEHILGKRSKNLIPLKSMLDAGLITASGSDAPCTMPDPIFSIYCACNHPNHNESISVIDALRMHTNQASKLSFDEDTRGSLTKGKVADFVILDKNPLKIPVDKINGIKIENLYLNGKKYVGQDDNPYKLFANAIIKRFI